MTKPTTITLQISQQFKALAPRYFMLGNVELFMTARRIFNTDTMVTFKYEGYEGLDVTHSLEFTVIYDDGSDTYSWSFSLNNEKTGETSIGEFEGMYWTQFEDIANLVDYGLNKEA